MVVLSVPEMHCENCVKRISDALTEAGIRFEISLEKKTVSIDSGNESIQTAIAALDDLGFDAEINL